MLADFAALHRDISRNVYICTSSIGNDDLPCAIHVFFSDAIEREWELLITAEVFAKHPGLPGLLSGL